MCIKMGSNRMNFDMLVDGCIMTIDKMVMTQQKGHAYGVWYKIEERKTVQYILYIFLPMD